jgi:hypothetical protein
MPRRVAPADGWPLWLWREDQPLLAAISPGAVADDVEGVLQMKVTSRRTAGARLCFFTVQLARPVDDLGAQDDGPQERAACVDCTVEVGSGGAAAGGGFSPDAAAQALAPGASTALLPDHVQLVMDARWYKGDLADGADDGDGPTTESVGPDAASPPPVGAAGVGGQCGTVAARGGGSATAAAAMRAMLAYMAVGAVVEARVNPGRARTGQASLYATHARLLRAAPFPDCVRAVLSATARGELGEAVAAHALGFASKREDGFEALLRDVATEDAADPTAGARKPRTVTAAAAPASGTAAGAAAAATRDGGSAAASARGTVANSTNQRGRKTGAVCVALPLPALGCGGTSLADATQPQLDGGDRPRTLAQRLGDVARGLLGLPAIKLRSRPPRITQHARGTLARLAAVLGVDGPPPVLPAFTASSGSATASKPVPDPFYPLPPTLVAAVFSNVPADIDGSERARRLEYLRARKLPQVAWLVARLADTLGLAVGASPGQAALDATVTTEGEEVAVAATPLLGDVSGIQRVAPTHTVWDVGGGRGDLAVAIACCLPTVAVRVIDIHGPSLARGRVLAAALGLGSHRITWEEADFLTEIPATAPAAAVATDTTCGAAAPALTEDRPRLPPPNAVVALHACGGLTDAILAYAAGAPATACVVVTCCFSSHVELAESAWARARRPRGLWTSQLPGDAGAQPAGDAAVDHAATGRGRDEANAVPYEAAAGAASAADADRDTTAALLRRMAEMTSVPEAGVAMSIVNELRLRGVAATGAMSMVNELRLNELRLNELRLYELRLNELRLNELRLNELRLRGAVATGGCTASGSSTVGAAGELSAAGPDVAASAGEQGRAVISVSESAVSTAVASAERTIRPGRTCRLIAMDPALTAKNQVLLITVSE